MIFIGSLIVGGLSLYIGAKAKKNTDKSQKNNANNSENIVINDKSLPVVEQDSAKLTVSRANKNFNIASASLALMIAGNTLFMPLTVIGVSGLIYLVYPIWQKAYYDLTQKRRFTRMVLESILLPATLLTGHIFSAALAYWFLYLALKVIAKAKYVNMQNLTHTLINPVEHIVYVIRDKSEIALNLAAVNKNDVIVLNEGESIPINGLIIKGSATIEQCDLNNKTTLFKKNEGNTISGYSRIKTGKIFVKVTQSYQEIQRLEDMSTCSNTLELRSVDIVDKLALPYFGIGSVIAWIRGINAGIAMLWVPLDDALYISGSLGVLNFLKIAMKRNILIKDGRALESLHSVDTFIFSQSTLIEKTSSPKNIYLKKNVKKIIRQLKKLNYKLCIISDNNQNLTKPLAQQLGIEKYFCNVSSVEKVNLIKEMQEKNRQKICYISNEFYDHKILQQVNVSVSLQDTSTFIRGAATAQVILINKDIEQLIDLLELATALNKTHTTNLIAGTIPSLMIVGGVLTVQISIPTAVLYYIAGMSASLASVTLPLLKENYRTKKLFKQHTIKNSVIQ